MTSKSISERLLSLDVRVLSVIVFIIVAIPLIAPFGIPFPIDRPVQVTYDYIRALPDGSVIVFQVASSWSQWGDVCVTTVALCKFIWNLDTKLKFIMYCTGIESASIVEKALELAGSIPADQGKVYGTDWVLFGYLPGDELAQARMAASFREAYQTDHYGTPTDTIPIMQGIDSAADVDLYVTQYGLSDGCDPGLRQWTYKYGTPTVLLPMSSGLTYAAQYFPNVVIGYMGGGGHAAQLELLSGLPGEATKYNDAKNLMYLVTDVFITLGTVVYWYRRYTGAESVHTYQRDRDYEG